MERSYTKKEDHESGKEQVIKMINKLVEQIQKKDAPVVVCLDPLLGYVPEHLSK